MTVVQSEYGINKIKKAHSMSNKASSVKVIGQGYSPHNPLVLVFC